MRSQAIRIPNLMKRIQPSVEGGFYHITMFIKGGIHMKYDASKKSLAMETAECKVNLSFSVTPKEASILYYVCNALTQQPQRLFKRKRSL